MLQEFKNLSIVTTHVPLALSRLGTEYFVVASLGRQFVVYCTDRLQVQFMSPVLAGEITALVSADELTFVAIARQISVYHRFVRLAVIDVPPPAASASASASSIVKLALFEDSLVSICSSGQACLFDKSALTSRLTQTVCIPLVAVLPLELVTCVTAVPTYTNKLLFGLRSGGLVLFNTRKLKLVHTFACRGGAGAGAGAAGPAAVTWMTPSRALDVVAVGVAGGAVYLVNTKTDQVLRTFALPSAATGAQFVSSSARELLAVGTTAGEVVLFDLTSGGHVGNLTATGQSAGGVTSLEVTGAGANLLVTAGEDNAIRMWQFDRPDGMGRLLRERVGFRGNLTHVLALSEVECLVGSDAGEVGRISLIQNQQNLVFSVGNLHKFAGEKATLPWQPHNQPHLGPVIALAANTLRAADWPTVVSLHGGAAAASGGLAGERAFVWSLVQGALVCRMLKAPGGRVCLTACAVSGCGNFAFVGSSEGAVFKFNLQSCLFRGALQSHSSRVLAIHCLAGAGGAMRSAVLTVSAEEVLLHEAAGEATRTLLAGLGDGRRVRSSSVSGHFVALAYVDGDIGIVDVQTDMLVRLIETGGFAVTALTWSTDQLHLIFSLVDGRLNVFDFQAATLRDQAQLDPSHVVTSLVFMPHSASLALCRAGSRSLHLFNNLLKLQGPAARPPCPSQPVLLEGEAEAEAEPAALAAGEAGAAAFAAGPADLAVHPGLLRRSQTQSLAQQRQLLHLAEIKSRNAVEATKAAGGRAVPFFLPTVTQLDGHVRFAAGAETGTTGGDGTEKKRKTEEKTLGEFFGLVAVGDWRGVLELLKSQTASGFHVLIGCLSTKEAEQMIKFFEWLVETGEEADLGQVWLTLFLQEHGSDLPGEALRDLAELVAEKEEQLATLGNRVQCFARMIVSGDVLL